MSDRIAYLIVGAVAGAAITSALHSGASIAEGFKSGPYAVYGTPMGNQWAAWRINVKTGQMEFCKTPGQNAFSPIACYQAPPPRS